MVVLKPADDGVHKYVVEIDGHTVRFGAVGYSDFTKHHDTKRKTLYLTRHRANEDWGYSGRFTAGFWSRWILWNQPSVGASLADVRRRFGL